MLTHLVATRTDADDYDETNAISLDELEDEEEGIAGEVYDDEFDDEDDEEDYYYDYDDEDDDSYDDDGYDDDEDDWDEDEEGFGDLYGDD